MGAPATIDWRSVAALTFDCYGTLVDWETGLARDLRAGLAPIPNKTDDELLALYARAEEEAERPPFRPYAEVLRRALAAVGKSLNAPVRDAAALVAGLPSWPNYPDTNEALRRLQRRFRLCVVSNVDRDLFAKTEARLGIRFDAVVTADEVRSYKPARAHFDAALARLALPAERVVHLAQSLHHDIATAGALGLRTVWIDRRAGRAGGATPTGGAAAAPTLRLTTLAELADRVEANFP
jgi:2-haloalkanoic acid dehalogenase type II